MNGSSATFTGVLVQRHYKTGQKYAQLVFHGAHETKLSISRNLQLVHSLKIGATYRITGKERAVGSKTIIDDPKAVAVKKSAVKSKKFWLITSTIICLLVLSGFAAAWFLSNQKNNATVAPAAEAGKVEAVQTIVPQAADTAAPANTTPQPQPAAATTQRTTTRRATTRTATTTTPTTQTPQSTPNTPAVTESAPPTETVPETTPPPVEEPPVTPPETPIEPPVTP